MNAETFEYHRAGQGTDLEVIVGEIENAEERFAQEGYAAVSASLVIDGLKGNHEIHILFNEEIEGV